VSVRRGPLVIALLVALVVAIVVGNANASTRRAATASTEAATMPAADMQSAAWFCPGAPPSLPLATDSITLSNTGAAPAEADLTVYPDRRGAPVQHRVQVPARSVQTLRRAALGPAGALTAETFSRDVVLESGVQSRDSLALTPCATDASASWYFAAGGTPRGVSQWLVLDDPFAADAKVDIVLHTNAGRREPDQLHGFDVARRSRAVIPIHDFAVRVNVVAVEIHARVGRIVAEQTLVYGPDAGARGVAVSLGQPVASTMSYFADGLVASNTSTSVTVANVGTNDTEVELQAFPAGGVGLAPVTLALPRDAVARVPIGGCRPGPTSACVAVPARASYALRVRSMGGVPLVAEVLQRGTGSSNGAAITSGVQRPARGWVFARSRVAGETAGRLAFTNPGTADAHVAISFVSAGAISQPASLRAVRVPPGGRVPVDIGRVAGAPRSDAALVVTADREVAVEQTIVGAGDLTRSAGVPIR
jgi:Family of unknown function (DUF5719)